MYMKSNFLIKLKLFHDVSSVDSQKGINDEQH